MDTLLAEMINQLNAVHDLVEKAVIDLPNEALDWTPGPGLNSLGVLLALLLILERRRRKKRITDAALAALDRAGESS